MSISGLSRWKIFDNLRRSLVPPALVVLLLVGWLESAHNHLWTFSVLGMILVPALVSAVTTLVNKPESMTVRAHFGSVLAPITTTFINVAFALACLPYEAYYSLGAIVRTLWRMLVSRRHLLEWNTSRDAERGSRNDLVGALTAMWIGPALSVAVFLILREQPNRVSSAGPVLLLWFVSPWFAWWLGSPLEAKAARLSGEQIILMRRLARKTWAFFEDFVVAEDNWLPPDNFQQNPVTRVAHRTSPTNIGMALLANLTAYDFGYISTAKLLQRTANTLQTMLHLERYKGHFYNWYDTRTLAPLRPIYVSTVDSGNLAGHLLTLRSGLLEIINTPVVRNSLFHGLDDTSRILAGYAATHELKSRVARFRERLAAHPEDLTGLMEIAFNIPTSGGDEFVWWLNALRGQCKDGLDELALFPAGSAVGSAGDAPTLRELAAQNNQAAQSRITEIERLAETCSTLSRMDFQSLYDKKSHLLSIGYNVIERRPDSSYYDLLASEARLCYFVAIAQGQLPQQSWFALGRLLATVGGDSVLVSWSGSMFEYLMPLLVMPTYANTLLDETYKAVVRAQIRYGAERGVPWGISESGYNSVDAQLNYQYRAFGVPGTGLKRGLAEDLVIAPYASVMALMVAPEQACANLEKLIADGFEGRYGLYEAIDYTVSRLPRGQGYAIIESFMAHHQGMSFLSLSYTLLDRPMQRRFDAERLFQGTTLLLQERVPKVSMHDVHNMDFDTPRSMDFEEPPPVRVLTTPHTPIPELQLLSNGRYHVMVTNSGGGYSRWKNISVTRWREDTTCDSWGVFCYVRDIATGSFWSATHQPVGKPAEQYEAAFSEARIDFMRLDQELETHTEIAVSPEDDVELRRIRVTNRSRRPRKIDLTTYAEVVLAAAASDAAHPAFSNLFVQTEILEDRRAIICTRRPRSSHEHPPWMFHLLTVRDGPAAEAMSYETDRARFVGRENTVADPAVMRKPGALSGSSGSVLDPIAAIRYQTTLGAEEAVTIEVMIGVGDSREVCMNMIEKYQDNHLANRVFDLAWTHSQVVLRQINASEAESQVYARLAGPLVFANAGMRAEPGVLLQNRRGQSGLWGYSISGDFPIALLQISDTANIELVRQLVQAHAWWRLKGLPIDLVIVNEDREGYRQQLQDQVMGLIASGVEANNAERTGEIFVRSADQMSPEDRILLQTVARVIVSDTKGTLAEQVDRQASSEVVIPALKPGRTARRGGTMEAVAEDRQLLFSNGIGGFTPDGREYVIRTDRTRVTPAPWVNVIANRFFGTVVSEGGTGCTWAVNAQEYRISPWNNDPVSDGSGEACYIRDEETGYYWSPTPAPARGATPYTSRHGFGYSAFEHTEEGIWTETWVYVDLEMPVKFTVIKIRNDSDRARKLTATAYVDWVLGDLRTKTSMHVVTEIDANTGALLARNAYNAEFPARVAFLDVDDAQRSVTGNRAEFIGRNRTLRNPAAMSRIRLSGRSGAALDPCGAMQAPIELLPGQEREIVFRLGTGRDVEDAKSVIQRFRGVATARKSLEAVWEYWKHSLGAVNVQTPDDSLNVLANGWLVYQAFACRVMARTAFYQPGGAFGFRDQLQDTMALVHAEPWRLREQILLCASRQFPEGDVQHWWHPPTGRGVRTTCSDDFLWLPLATCRYVLATRDMGILDERTTFLHGRALKPDEDSYYDLPVISEETATLYDHCVLALRKGLTKGSHGLPLMGSGDWNDGMNLVGDKGKGESVWLAFFLYNVLKNFTSIAQQRGDLGFVETCESEASLLRFDVEANGWDGEWYRRAYFDDGAPLGSAGNDECRIDSIAQSWAVLSKAADPKRARKAMDQVDKQLVRPEMQLVQLLDPPFDKSAMEPGYIKGYVPGVRENGGQYTHAAIWATMAFAELGDHARAWKLFNMINPVNHASTAEALSVYKVEPYVVAADVYARHPHEGRGGWTWYTGSAGWMYRLILESLLGVALEGDRLRLTPCLPPEWKSLTIHYRYRNTVHHLAITQETANAAGILVTADGIAQIGPFVPLVDDGVDHSAIVKIMRLQTS